MDKFHFHKYATVSKAALPSGRNPGNTINIMVTKKCKICDKETYVIDRGKISEVSSELS